MSKDEEDVGNGCAVIIVALAMLGFAAMVSNNWSTIYPWVLAVGVILAVVIVWKLFFRYGIEFTRMAMFWRTTQMLGAITRRLEGRPEQNHAAPNREGINPILTVPQRGIAVQSKLLGIARQHVRDYFRQHETLLKGRIRLDDVERYIEEQMNEDCDPDRLVLAERSAIEAIDKQIALTEVETVYEQLRDTLECVGFTSTDFEAYRNMHLAIPGRTVAEYRRAAHSCIEMMAQRIGRKLNPVGNQVSG